LFRADRPITFPVRSQRPTMCSNRGSLNVLSMPSKGYAGFSAANAVEQQQSAMIPRRRTGLLPLLDSGFLKLGFGYPGEQNGDRGGGHQPHCQEDPFPDASSSHLAETLTGGS
jgi:hypothetical protein